MPPRLQCLTAAKTVSRQSVSSNAAFSTTARALAERESSASSLLSTSDSISSPSASRPNFTINRRPANSPNSFTQSQPRYSPRNRPAAAPNGEANTRLLNLLEQESQRRPNRRGNNASSEATIQDLERSAMSKDLHRMLHRRWRAGDVYAPHDMSPVEMDKWKKRSAPERDVFDALDMNPVEEYKNFSILSEYMTPMGRIKHSAETGLRPRNQRKIAKAIRRSIGLGLMPSVHRHPEILQKEIQRRTDSANRQASFM